jgi:hypothetical protein
MVILFNHASDDDEDPLAVRDAHAADIFQTHRTIAMLMVSGLVIEPILEVWNFVIRVRLNYRFRRNPSPKSWEIPHASENSRRFPKASLMTNDRPQKTVAIVQSNYIPWKGYFDLINQVDDFVFFDDMQYTRRDWRNRNLIKTREGLQWLTIPVDVKGKYLQKIKDTKVSDPSWTMRHLATITHNYASAPHFKIYKDSLTSVYRSVVGELYLSNINRRFVEWICLQLGITTALRWSTDYSLKDGKTERLVDLCESLGATHYLSGPAARDYIDPSLFHEAGIELRFVDYADYPEYPQLFGQFQHGVTVLDLLFNIGPEAPRYMKSFRFSQSGLGL